MESNKLPLRICVAICTHNPNLNQLAKVISCIEKNRASSDFRLVVIDNASKNSTDIQNLCHGTAEYHFESRKGNSYARYKALKLVSFDELLIFIDDDNYVAPNFIAVAREISAAYPECGCFGGRTYQSPFLKTKPWNSALLPYVGILNKGDEIQLSNATLQWNELEPIGAGMCLRPEVVLFCISTIESFPTYFELGRSGVGLLSGEDSFIARHTAKLNLKYGYFPGLKIIHDIKPTRLKFSYLAKLLYSYGISDVILNSAMKVAPDYPYPNSLMACIGQYLYIAKRKPSGFIIGLRQFGQYSKSKKV